MTISYEWLGALILTIVSSSWFGTFISNKTSHKDLKEAIEELDKKIDRNEAKQEQKEAEHLRSKILRFDDELRLGIKHSQEYFDDVIHDITNYEAYCKTHPDFINRKAERAITHIISAYDNCHTNNNFL